MSECVPTWVKVDRCLWADGLTMAVDMRIIKRKVMKDMVCPMNLTQGHRKKLSNLDKHRKGYS